MKPLVVVVQGPPAAGKTTVARALAARLRLPLLAKDTVKEALFDGLGSGDLAWSQRLGGATYLTLLRLAEESVELGVSVALEGNFVCGSEFEAGLRSLAARFVQVHCSAPLELLSARYGSRERHAGHGDGERIHALRDAVETGRHEPLDLPGETIRLDTSRPVDAEDLARRVRRAALWERLADAVLATPGALPEPARRAIAAGHDPPRLAPLLASVRRAPYRITDADLAGLEPDVVVEASLAAALGVALARRRQALEAVG